MTVEEVADLFKKRIVISPGGFKDNKLLLFHGGTILPIRFINFNKNFLRSEMGSGLYTSACTAFPYAHRRTEYINVYALDLEKLTQEDLFRLSCLGQFKGVDNWSIIYPFGGYPWSRRHGGQVLLRGDLCEQVLEDVGYFHWTKFSRITFDSMLQNYSIEELKQMLS